MIRAFSFPVSPERSRLRGWLEGTLAGLCELHLLRERQERRVRQALCIASESPKQGAGEAGGAGVGEPAPEEQLDNLPALMWEMEQQLGLLHLYQEKTAGEAPETDSWPSSGFYEGPQSAVASDSPASGLEDSSSSFPSASGSYSRSSRPDSHLGYSNERPKSVGDVANSSKERASRSSMPRSSSAPYATSQDHPAEPPPPPRFLPDPFLYPSPLHAVALQSPLLQSHLYEDAAFSATAEALTYPADPEAGLEAYGSDFQLYSEAASQGQRVESYISQLLRRRSQLVRGSKPRTSLGSEPPTKGNLVRQSSLCKRPVEPHHLQAERRHPPAVERGSSAPSPCGHEGGTTAATRIWSSWDAAAERSLAAKAVAEEKNPPPSSLRKPPKLQALAHMRPFSVDPYQAAYSPSPFLDREDAAPRGNRQDPVSYESEEGGCLMVKAQYIPAQQHSRAQQALRAGKKKPPPLTKGRSVDLSPEQVPLLVQERPRLSAPAKKCRFTEEGGEGVGRKGAGRKSSPKSKKAARSQSENSLLNRSRAKYGTAEREESAQKPARLRRPSPGNLAGGYRKWRSTAEISQEDPSPGGAPEPLRGQQGSDPAGYPYLGSDSECSGEAARPAPMCHLEEGLVYGDTESSLSDGDSPPPYSSGASSDTDESGGLVWPQQLSPQLVSASGPGKSTSGQPKVFVKIKASHALKKKIMRFRSGSLKVMTTV